MRLLLVLCGLCGFTGCPAPPTSSSPTPDVARAPTNERRAAPAIAAHDDVNSCTTAPCWQARAKRSADRGVIDVAAAYLGRAYTAQPTADTLGAWLDALVGTGQWRRAHQALAEARAHALTHGDTAMRALVDQHIAHLSPAGLDRPIPALAATDEIRAAAAALDAGDVPTALALYTAQATSSPHPVHWTRVGDLAWRTGDRVRARRAWARARILLDEHGAPLQLGVVTKWYTSRVFWIRDRLAMLQYWRSADIERQGPSASHLTVWNPDDGTAPLRTLILPERANTAFPSADGRLLFEQNAGVVRLLDTATGLEQNRFSIRPEGVIDLVTSGDGDSVHVLLATEHGAALYTGDGTLLDTWTLQGTTPTITRVYRKGRGTRHDNILNNSPSWPVSLALSDDARWVAIGGSDSKIRLIDRKSGKTRRLAYKWTYKERRHRGGNPDHNRPLALRFVDGARTLISIFARGDMFRWRTRDGKPIRRIDGRCTDAEATPLVNQYNGPDDPVAAPTQEQRQACGRALHALLSRDGRLAVTSTGSGFRVRDTRAGQSVAMVVHSDVPDDMLAMSASGRLATSDIYGRPTLWTVGQKPAPMLDGGVESGPLDPKISANGRMLTFSLTAGTRVWDLLENRPLAENLDADERILAVSSDGANTVVKSTSGIELRTMSVQSVLLNSDTALYPSASFSASGERVLVSGQAASGRAAVVYDLRHKTRVELALPRDSNYPKLSADGSRVLAFGRRQPVRVWQADTGAQIYAGKASVLTATLSHDGLALAWIENSSTGQPVAVARYTRLPTRRPPQPGVAQSPSTTERIEIPGWAKNVRFSPDGDELLVTTQRQMVRWRPEIGSHRTYDEKIYKSYANRVRYSSDGSLLFFEFFGRIDVHHNDDSMTQIASLYPLLSDGWLARSADGAVDGSTGAIDNTMTQAGADTDRLVHTGYLSWDRFAVPGVYEAALDGESLKPPL